jgi:hypothetical protein
MAEGAAGASTHPRLAVWPWARPCPYLGTLLPQDQNLGAPTLTMVLPAM